MATEGDMQMPYAPWKKEHSKQNMIASNGHSIPAVDVN